MRSRLRTTLKSLAAGVTCVAVVSLGATMPAYAEPTTVAQAQAELERLHHESGTLEEAYAQAGIQLDEGRKRVEALRADIVAQQARVDELAEQARQVALAQFRDRNIDQTTALFVNGDPDSFMRTLSTTRKVADNMNAVVQEYQAQQANLSDLKRSAEAEVATLAEAETESSRILEEGRRSEAAMSRTLNRLTAAERAALEAAENANVVADAAVARSAAAPAQAAPADAAAPAASSPAVSAPTGGADARALKAVEYALSKVGRTQYVWGAEGPNSFDCSGLMLAAYKTAGVSLPHSSVAQSRLGAAVSRDQLKPGDLLFWYSPVSHVGMYVGNGNFVHARNTKVDIVMQPLSSYPAPYTGARRVVG